MSFEAGLAEIRRQHPIRQWFVIRRTPEGTAPVEIREQWLNVPLPLRHLRNMDAPQPAFGVDVSGDRQSVYMEDATMVWISDAIKSLNLFERQESAYWWERWRQNTGSGSLLFNATEGQYMSPDRLEAILPGINDFDRLD